MRLPCFRAVCLFFVTTAFCPWVLMGSGVSYAQPPVAGTQTPLNSVLIGLDKARALSWLKQGVRLTYLQTSAVIAGGFAELVPDEGGGIKDRRTGKKFQEIGQQGIAATAWLQLDVAAVHDDAVALDDRLYTLLDREHYTKPSFAGEVVAAGHGGDMWLDPEILKQQPLVQNDAVMIYRDPYKIGEKTYQAIFFSVHTPTSWTYAIYDLDSGLLLHIATAGVGKAHLERTGPDTMGMGAHDTILTQSTFVSLRQTQVPWAAAPLPRAAERNSLKYEGTDLVSASGVVTRTPLLAELKLHDRVGDTVPITLTVQGHYAGVRGPPITSTEQRVVAPGELMPFFIDPAALAKLHQGQEIDHDPATRYTVSVTFTGRDGQGHDAAVLTESAEPRNPSSQMQYDRTTGLAKIMVVNLPANHQEIRLVLKSQE